MPDTGKPRLLLVWHEAGNRLYHDRFIELSQHFDLTVLGPDRFQGVDFPKDGAPFDLRLFPAVLTGHWLTFLSLPLILYVARTRTDILYLHEEPHSLMAFVLSLFKRKSKVLLESSAINLKGNFKGFNLLERTVYRQADAILPKNPEVGDILVSRGASRAKVQAPIGNGVSRSSFDIIDKASARAQLAARFPQLPPFAEGDLVVGYAGRIWNPKGLDLFADLARQSGVRPLICGEVVDADLAERLTAAGIVLLPKLGKSDLRLFYAALDVFILPSLSTPGWREQFGRVCIEAIFSGTPAVGSAVGGIPMVIGTSQTFPPADHGAAIALIDTLRDPARRAALLAEQEQHVEDNFTWSAIARQVARVYAGLR